MKPLILSALMEHFTAGEEVLTGPATPEEAAADEDELSKQIRELIDTRVRPQVAQDGGDIVFRRFEEGIVYLNMQGSCSGCPSSTATLQHGIENMLKYYVPEVTGVQAVD
jgi:Fe-S cluster biogenesis protein NfuA